MTTLLRLTGSMALALLAAGCASLASIWSVVEMALEFIS